jgi:hypothetical protein
MSDITTMETTATDITMANFTTGIHKDHEVHDSYQCYLNMLSIASGTITATNIATALNESTKTQSGC